MLPQTVIQEFAEGSLDFVDEFWIKVYEIYGDQYNDVYRCPDCKKFELDFFEERGKIIMSLGKSTDLINIFIPNVKL